ncbi:larval cuticle protein 65Ag1-like [Drosophila santomea]|uniref:larval cuticle protein 65Ag1-like n=1 Tax=Drosophila santomea TaxID=129105 RepID=UPI00195418D4|nr:larval cuticle protein 65Ag1-like [Drosophila santomea]
MYKRVGSELNQYHSHPALRDQHTIQKIKMKFLIVFVALFALTAAGSFSKEAQIERQFSDVGPEGFSYDFSTTDGVAAQAAGLLKNAGTKDEALAVKGSFSFVADDGQTYTVNYVADENGYQPQGAHLPVAPVA